MMNSMLIPIYMHEEKTENPLKNKSVWKRSKFEVLNDQTLILDLKHDLNANIKVLSLFRSKVVSPLKHFQIYRCLTKSSIKLQTLFVIGFICRFNLKQLPTAMLRFRMPRSRMKRTFFFLLVIVRLKFCLQSFLFRNKNSSVLDQYFSEPEYILKYWSERINFCSEIDKSHFSDSEISINSTLILLLFQRYSINFLLQFLANLLESNGY